MTLSLALSGALPLMTTSTTDPAAAAGGVIGGLVGAIIGLVIIGFALMGIFKKAGQPAWAGFVPIYNTIVLLRISGLSPWLVLLGLIPFVGGFILLVLIAINLSKVFGQSVLIAVLTFLLPVVMYFVLSYGSARYLGTEAARYPLGQAPNAQMSSYQA